MGSDTAVEPTIQGMSTTAGRKEAAQRRCPLQKRERPQDLIPNGMASSLSEMDGRALCYPALSQVVRLRKCRRDGVNHGSFGCRTSGGGRKGARPVALC